MFLNMLCKWYFMIRFKYTPKNTMKHIKNKFNFKEAYLKREFWDLLFEIPLCGIHREDFKQKIFFLNKNLKKKEIF